MATNGGSQVNGVWKWLAAICLTVLISGAPGILYALRTWNTQSQVEIIRERQDDVRTRLAVLEAQHRTLVDEIIELRLEIAKHVDNDSGGTK